MASGDGPAIGKDAIPLGLTVHLPDGPAIPRDFPAAFAYQAQETPFEPIIVGPIPLLLSLPSPANELYDGLSSVARHW